ncbi:MAG TPA: serine/threonine-protein kinase, partial [Dongiaceae bacterium]|nr:serine/threonine-protein kinase [Dongiaceae bacterium]
GSHAMADAATTLIAQARAAGIIDERAAQTILAMHRQSQTTDDGPAGDLSPEASAKGERFGKFVLVEKIGEGGMGTVWKAYQTDLRRTVAIKFVKDDDPEILARFIREAQTAAGLSHPNIVATFDAGEIEGRHFISMDYIEGQDLKKRRVDVPTALALMRDAAEAVHYAHRHGIVHRDLKPANRVLPATVRDVLTARRVPCGCLRFLGRTADGRKIEGPVCAGTARRRRAVQPMARPPTAG